MTALQTTQVDGTATVDLRGLGSSRTLVLVNGTRANPTTQSGTVDINNIPAALIDRVEVLTGGASAVYGSDAVAGVVNFILKDDFSGVSFSQSAEQTENGDAGPVQHKPDDSAPTSTMAAVTSPST